MPAPEMGTPSAGLRRPGVRLRNRSNDIARASIVVPAGAEIVADEYVAAQLEADTAFERVTEPAPTGGVEEAGGGAARTRSGRRKG